MTGDLWSLDLVQLWDLVLGILLPLAIAIVTRASWSSRAKTLVMLAFVLATTVVAELFAGRLQQPDGWRGLVASFLVIFLLTVTTYRHVWRPTGIVPKLEDVTTPARRRALPDNGSYMTADEPMPMSTTTISELESDHDE